jgi:prepilin-type N-terminal cleavage/methylation domain-containing protein/prepilin-type processing-associated H-X9-DG protein
MHAPSKPTGFTLIELLVVIAIIAILAAILFPVFAQAREKARAITCVSNEKQIGLGFLQYVQDYDERFPPAQEYPDAAGNSLLWMSFVYPYIKSGDNAPLSGDTFPQTSGTSGVFVCPDFPVPQDGTTYGVNITIDSVYYGSTLTPPPPPATLAQLQTPSDTVLVSEMGADDGGGEYDYFDPEEDYWASGMGTAGGNYLDYTHYDLGYNSQDAVYTNCDATSAQIAAGNYTYGGCGMTPRYRHTNTSNFIFSDGHAKAIVIGQLSWYRNIYVQGNYEALECPTNGFCAPY